MALNDSISDVEITQFAENVFELAAQTAARTRPYVEMVQVNALDMMLPRLGSIEAQELTERNPVIVPAEAQWDNRRLSAKRIGVAQLLDKWDAKKMLVEPKSPLARRAAQALERYFDKTVLTEALATVYTGRQGTTAVTAASDGVKVVDAKAGLTYEKLLEIDETFQSVEIGTETEVKKVLFITEQEHTQLMKEGTLISGDFSRQYVVDNGKMRKALNFELVIYGSKVANPLLKVVSNVRSCIAMAFGAMKVGITQNWEIEEKDANNRWHSRQILASGIFGAVRMEGARMIEVQTTPTS